MKCSRILISIVFLLLILKTALAYAEEEWNRTYGGEGFDYAYSVAQTSDGGYIIAGVTNSYGNGREDAWLLRTDADGNEIWNRTFGGVLEDAAYSVIQTDDNGYIIAGHSKSFGNEKDVWLLKVDSDGNEVWNKTINLNFDVVRLISRTEDGGYIIAGEIDDLRYSDIHLVKFNSDWEEEWNTTLGGTLGEYIHTVLQTEDGYIIAGNKWDYIKERHYALLLKLDSEGNQTWNRTFGGPELDVFTSVKKTSDGGYIIAGFKSSSGNGREDAWLLRTDADGNEIWNRTFGGILEDAAYSVIQTDDNGYIIAGHTRSKGHGIFPDAWLIKLSSDEAVRVIQEKPKKNENVSEETEKKSAGFEAVIFFSALTSALYLLKNNQKKS